MGRWTATFGVGWGIFVRGGVGSRDGSGGICHKVSIIRQRWNLYLSLDSVF